MIAYELSPLRWLAAAGQGGRRDQIEAAVGHEAPITPIWSPAQVILPLKGEAAEGRRGKTAESLQHFPLRRLCRHLPLRGEELAAAPYCPFSLRAKKSRWVFSTCRPLVRLRITLWRSPG